MRYTIIGTGVAPSFSPTVHPKGAAKPRHYVVGSMFAMAFALCCFYWIAFPVNNMKITHGPQQVNHIDWRSSRYTWGWANVYILVVLNLLLGYLWAAALLNNTVPEFAKLHKWVAKIFLVLNFVVFLMLSFQWLFYCNTGGSAASPCNDARWCCVHFGSNAEASHWCPNTNPCVPDVTAIHRNDEFFQTWLFSIFFVLWSWAHASINKDFWREGVFRKFED